jgi:hypothetical protein
MNTSAPFTLPFIVFSVLLIIFLPRRLAIFPLLLTVCYFTLGQGFIIAELHFPVYRILIFAGFFRLIIRNELSGIDLNTIDKAMIWWMVIAVITGTLLEKWDGFINRSGGVYSVLGSYFLSRFLIRDRDDLLAVYKIIAIIIVPLTILVILEKATGRNLFSIFGAVPEVTQIRDGRIRCQGPFAHPILMGTFAATSIPLFFSLGFFKGGKLYSIVGIICATIITFAAASSGPAVTYLYVIIVFMIWPFRYHMRSIRWLIVISLVSLQFMMKAPIWYLSARLAEIIGGTGFHRSELISQAINHFNDWWMIGTTYTAHWMPYALAENPNSADITSQYIYEGVNGGIIRLGAFIIVLILCFRALGKKNLKLKEQPLNMRVLSWSLGAALFAHILSFLSVMYFDQIIVFFYLLLSIISTFTTSIEPCPNYQVISGLGSDLPPPN